MKLSSYAQVKYKEYFHLRHLENEARELCRNVYKIRATTTGGGMDLVNFLNDKCDRFWPIYLKEAEEKNHRLEVTMRKWEVCYDLKTEGFLSRTTLTIEAKDFDEAYEKTSDMLSDEADLWCITEIED